MKALQGMLGHANFQTTMNIYADLDMDKMRESSCELGAEYAKICEKSCKKLQDMNNAKSLDLYGL